MKLSRKFKICTSILIVLVIAALVVLNPIQKKLETIVIESTQKLNALLYEKAEITVSYESFSPSILAGFKIENIKCLDNKQETVVSIKDLKVQYSLMQAIKGDYSNIIRSASMDGVTVDISKIVEIVILAGQKNRKDEITESEKQKKEPYVFEFQPIYQFIPSVFKISDLYLIYNNDVIDSNYYVNSLAITNFKRRRSLDLELQGKMHLVVKENNLNVDGNVFVAGNVTDTLENSTARVIASDFDVYGYKIGKQTILANYKDFEVSGHSIQTINPLYIYGSYNFKEMYTDFGFKTDNFAVTSVFSAPDKNLEEMVKDFRLSINADGEYRIKEKELTFSSEGGIYVPQRFVPEGLNVSYDLFGDLKSLHINYLNARGALCDASTHLDFIYRGLKLDGELNVLRYNLPNGNIISSKIFFDNLSRGFSIFAPKVYIGSKVLTGMQASIIPLSDSIDFEFEVTDYSESQNPEETVTEKGIITIDGSYLQKSNYLQTNVSLNTLSIKSIIEYVQQLVPASAASSLTGIAGFTEPYVFSGDVYLSSDLKSVSYNVPYIIVANTQQDNQYLFASLDGNEQNIQLNRFDLILGSFATNITGAVDIDPQTKDVFFMLDTIASSIPYHINGNYRQNSLELSGDYGISCNFDFDKDSVIGNFQASNLPVIMDKMSLIFSTDTSVTYTKEDGPQIFVQSLEIEKSDISSSINPKLTLSGSGTKYGAQLSSITYSDRFSTLDGAADIRIDMNEGIVNSASINLKMLNKEAGESILFDITASNPDKVPLSMKSITESVYLNSNLDITNFGLSRFTSVKNSNNSLTASASLTGTIEHPYASIGLDKVSFLLGNAFITSKGNFFLEDRLLSVSDFSVKYPSWGFSDFSGSVDLSKFDGEFNALFSAGGESNDLEVPLKVSVYDSFYTQEQWMPDVFTVTLSIGEISGSMMKKPVSFEISANYSPDFISIFSSDNIGLVGTYIPETGEIFGSIDSDGIVAFDIGGLLNLNKMNVDLSNINIDIKKIMTYFNFDDLVKVENAVIEGNVNISGNFDTPEFLGRLDIVSPKLSVPMVFKNQLSTDKISLIAVNNEFTLEQSVYSIKNVPKFTMDGHIVLNKWSPDSILFNLITLKNQALPVNFNNKYSKIAGDISCNLNMIYDHSVWNIGGKVGGENVDVIFDAEKLAAATSSSDSDKKAEQKDSSLALVTDLTVIFGTHVMLNFKPFLRCILAPNSSVALQIDTEAKSYVVDGEVKIKSGDVSYLQRSFYIKEGKIKFNPDNIANPLITIRAETREKDSKNQQVKIILSAENQYVQDLSPKFTSIPAKSETEIMTLLGQVVLADSESIGEILVSVGEYYIQSKFMGDIENKLRDLMNFDIFSVKTNFLQNTINLSTSGNLQKENISIGNFLDNTTVYIGKYLGSSLYVDAMMNLSFEDGNVNDITAAGGLLFKPEIGLELELPIANIRWSMAPDINALMDGQYVPSTSVSLSWKFSF